MLKLQDITEKGLGSKNPRVISGTHPNPPPQAMEGDNTEHFKILSNDVDLAAEQW